MAETPMKCWQCEQERHLECRGGNCPCDAPLHGGLLQPKTPVEQLASEIDDIHDKWFHRNSHALADILDAVARYEAKR